MLGSYAIYHAHDASKISYGTINLNISICYGFIEESYLPCHRLCYLPWLPTMATYHAIYHAQNTWKSSYGTIDLNISICHGCIQESYLPCHHTHTTHTTT